MLVEHKSAAQKQLCGPLCRPLFQHHGELRHHPGQREVKTEKATPAVPHQTNDSLAPQSTAALPLNIRRSITVCVRRRSIPHIKSLGVAWGPRWLTKRTIKLDYVKQTWANCGPGAMCSPWNSEIRPTKLIVISNFQHLKSQQKVKYSAAPKTHSCWKAFVHFHLT